MNTKLQKGIKLAFATAFISGFAGFVNKAAVTQIPPLLHTTLKNSLVFFFIAGAFLLLKRIHLIKKLSRKNLITLILIGIIGGALPFYLFFKGLSMIPVAHAMLIHKTLFIWVALMAVPFLKEKVTRKQIAAIAIIFLSNFILGGFEGFLISAPALMIFAATLFWAVENILAKKILPQVDSMIVAGFRMGVGSAILLVAVTFSGQMSAIPTLSASQWSITALSAFILFGYVTTWYKALSLAPATLVSAILTSSTLITTLLSSLFITRAFPTADLTQIILTAGSIYVIVDTYKKQQFASLNKRLQ